MSQISDYPLEHAEVRVESDLVFVRLHGRFTEQQIPQVLKLIEHVQQEQHERFFLLVDLHETTRLPPAMRRMLAQAMGGFQPAAMGIFGANAEQRGTHALLMGAVTSVSGHRPNTAYFATEAEARAWLQCERQRLIDSAPAEKT